MDVQLIPATMAFVPEMANCGCRAFQGNALDLAIFPNRSEAFLESKELLKFRMDRIQKRLQSPDWHYVLAKIDLAEAPAKVVGFAAWMAPSLLQNATEQQQVESTVKSQTQQHAPAEEDEYNLKSIDMDALKYASEAIDKAKKEILGKEENRVWYLASLAVDPDFKGKGIATNLVQWGISKADEVRLPAYLESSPEAVNLYSRLGFKELRKLSVIRNDDSYVVTVMMRTPGGLKT